MFGATEVKAQRQSRTDAALGRVGIGHALAKRPPATPDGTQQRVGLARVEQVAA